MKIGIPKGLLYYRYETLWKTFFSELGIDYIVSPDTNKEIMNSGKCSNNCEIICLYEEDKLIDSWGNKCERGAIRIPVI